jgi:hypothetical protein
MRPSGQETEFEILAVGVALIVKCKFDLHWGGAFKHHTHPTYLYNLPSLRRPLTETVQIFIHTA